MEKEYYVIAPEHRSEKIKEENISSWLKEQETDFYKEQLAKGRDYCFFCNIVETAHKDSFESRTLMAYTLTDPSNMNAAAKNQFILKEDEVLHVHAISVLRDGLLIDKLPDINVKVLDNVTSDSPETFDNEKSVTILIRDLHLHDIFIIETRVQQAYKDETIRHDYFRYVYSYPGPYWAYNEYSLELKNETGKDLTYNQHYFRDDKGEVLSIPEATIPNQESFLIQKNQYIGSEQNEIEITPFIDFTTKADYQSITSYFANLYEPFYDVKLTDFAPDLANMLDGLATLDEKIQYAIDFVQKEVYYLYNATEMDGHTPQAADVTYRGKQGDCKAKTLLLKIILNYLGIDSSIILINPRADIFLPVYTPSPLVFSHAILKIYYEEEIYFVDATVLNDCGFLANRQKYSFMYYLELKPQTELQKQEPFKTEKYEVEEIIHCDVKEDVACFTLNSILRGSLAISSREAFKTQPNKDILDRYNQSVFNMMNLFENFDKQNIDENFLNASIELVKDDKELNEISIHYKTDIRNAYTLDDQKRYLKYWDASYFLHDEAESFYHKDFPLWLNRYNVKMEIHLSCDHDIKMDNSVTCQEADINTKFLQHQTKKEVRKNGVSCYIEHNPYRNAILSGKELEEYVAATKEVRDDHWGVGIELLEDGLFKKISRFFKNK